VNFNPCGAIVDWGRDEYTEEVQVFRNDDRTEKILWYNVPDTNPVLDVPSFMFNRINLRDKQNEDGTPMVDLST